MSKFREIKFTDADILNVEDFIPKGEYNPHKVLPWLIHDHGFTIAVVFASCLQDALDICADAGKLDAFRVDHSILSREENGQIIPGEYGPNDDGIAFLGNASEPFDIESLGCEELPIPAFSFCALWDTDQK